MPGDRPAGDLRGTRSPAVGVNGMIATSQTLASAAGLKVLQDGGNAIDAAVTAAGVLAVVEPSMNGIGGDLLALVWDAATGRVHGLDATGRSAYAATPDAFAARGIASMPGDGPLVVDVPGVVEGWSQLLTRFGTTTLAAALQPAIGYARDGFPVAEIIAADWADSAERLARDPAAAQTFLPGGRAPHHGELFTNPRLAHSLELIARDGRDAFYAGPLARAIADDMRARGGLLDERDFAEHTADWVEPISTTYRGHDPARDAAEHARIRGTRDVEHPRGLRHRRPGTQLRGLPARARRGEEDCLRRSRGLSRRSRRDVEGRARDADLEGLRRGETHATSIHSARRAIARARCLAP